MAQSFGKFVADESTSTLKHWLLSQSILTLITFGGLMLGLNLIGIQHWILASVVITLVDLLPVVGLSATMIPWAVYELAIAKDTRTGLWIFLLFLIIMVVKQILEPFIRGKSLGISPWEEVVSSIAGFALTGGNAVGLILGPCVYIVGKKVYRSFHPQLESTGSTAYFNSGFGSRGTVGASDHGFRRWARNHNDFDDKVIDITDDVEEVKEES